PSRLADTGARAGSRSPGSHRRRPRPPAGSFPRRSRTRADNATRTRNASAWLGTLAHASGPPSRAWSWSTTRLAGGPDAISRLAGVWLVQLDETEADCEAEGGDEAGLASTELERFRHQ